MGKLISNIQNYPLSEGAVAYNNRLLLDDSYAIQTNTLKDYFKIQFEISKDINFFTQLGSNINSWNDLLKQESIYQFSRFLTIPTNEIHQFFVELPQTNQFLDDVELQLDEYEKLCYQKFQILQYLFWFYKTISETITTESQIQNILRNDPISKLFVQFNSLFLECLATTGDPNTELIPLASHKSVENFNEIQFPKVDKLLLENLNSYFNPLPNIGNKVLGVYLTKYDQLKAANEYAYSIFRNLLQTHQTFTYWATNKLEVLTNNTNSHQAHTSLLIAFCKLKMLYDARYNQLIHENTNFIFSDILQLKKQAILPDTAFVNIELAKNVNSYFVAKDTLFKANKNSENKQVYYKAAQDIVLNPAKIAAIKSMVRVNRNDELYTITATEEANDTEWQVNDAWLPFNDLSESFSGLAFESKLLKHGLAKGAQINFDLTFGNNVPVAQGFSDKFTVILMEADGKEISLKINSVANLGNTLTISAKIENELKKLKEGINARLKLVSPSKNEQDPNDFVMLYKYLLSEPLGKFEVKLSKQTFAPSNVDTTAGTIDGNTSFAAFGAQSMAGSSFRIANPFIEFANEIDITLNWAEKLENVLVATVNNQVKTFLPDKEYTNISILNDKKVENIRVRLEGDATYFAQSTITRGSVTSTITTELPKVLTIKTIELAAELEEVIYLNENALPAKFTETYYDYIGYIKSIRTPYSNKTHQKTLLHERHKKYRQRKTRTHHNNLLNHAYPLGELKLDDPNGITFLPNYKILGFNDFEADLYIGLINIVPGQTISLLFEIANETADQTELEAKISWHIIVNNKFEAIDKTKITDSTNNFLQSGLVQLSLPDTATNNNTLVVGDATYWLVARCDKNYEVVANIKNIKTNGLAVDRLFDENNQEAKKSVGAATIENIYPKTANIKSVSQNTPSQNGRETETDQHFFWRASNRLRHKQRAVNQWDYEQMVLEKFSNIYKVKCLNHAFFESATAQIFAKPTNTVISLIPHFIVDSSNANFQPAIALSKLLEVKSYLLKKTSAFNKLQVLNSQWDEVKIEIEAILNEGVLDKIFYREKLNEDLKKFLSPWAFESAIAPVLSQKIYAATLVDYIDELPYIHHIRSLKIFKNGIEVFDEIMASSVIHILTSATDHSVTVVEFSN